MAEDDAGDAGLIVEEFKDPKVRNNTAVVEDGKDALAYLRNNAPLLPDLRMPKKDGRGVLVETPQD